MIARGSRARFVALALLTALRQLHAQQELPLDKLPVAAAVRADLEQLTDLERSWFATHQRYTDDIKALNFIPKSGASIAVSYASARTFSASASHARLAPFICFSIVSTPLADSPADKPFCTDSRYGTAASALARGGSQSDIEKSSAAPPRAKASVTPVTTAGVRRTLAKSTVLTTSQFADQLRHAALFPHDSVVVVVQFAVKDARYDPSRGILEIALERVPLPLELLVPADTGSPRLPLECRARPVFVCGEAGLSYIARDLWRIPLSKAPSADVLRSRMTLQARFQIGRREDTRGPALTLLALVLQADGVNVSRWDAASGH